MHAASTPETARQHYWQEALGILDYIDGSLERRKRAAYLAQLALPFGSVTGTRPSVLDLPPESLITEVNLAIAAIQGIVTSFDGEGPVLLTEWHGPDTEIPDGHIWIAHSPARPGQFATVLLDPYSLRRDLLEQWQQPGM